MDVLPNEEEEMLKRSAREFLEKECPVTLVREMEKDERGYPPDLWRKMAELGWLGMALPEEYGGAGVPLTHLGLVIEEIGRAIAPVPFHCTMTAALTIASDGTPEQKQAILPAVARGQTILTWAFQEADPRLAPEAVQMQAVPQGDAFLLTGQKNFVDNFHIADYCLVACRTAPPSPASAGLSLFLVNTKSPGISLTPLITLARDKQFQVTFDGVRVPRTSLVGELNQGWPVIERMLDRGTALLCAQMLGAARKDAEMAWDYSKRRIAFGRPIGSFQSLQHLMADMLIWLDGVQLLTYEALWRLGEGLPASVEVSQAKAFANEKCQAVVRSSQSIHGGIGFIEEFPLHLWYRRVAAWAMRLGTTFEHRARVSRALLDKPGEVRLGVSPSEAVPSPA
ncbi:MAG: acyl-CoA dehydrogenase family protein [Dehalococcoidia bacterium]